MSDGRPEFPHRPHFPPVPPEWQQACGDLITSWAQVEFALHLIVLELRWRLKVPPSEHDPRRYESAPKYAQIMGSEIRKHLKKVPELAEQRCTLLPLLKAVGPLARVRNDVAHGRFAHRNLSGEYVLYKPAPATPYVYRELRFSINSIHAFASSMRDLSGAISDVGAEIRHKTR